MSGNSISIIKNGSDSTFSIESLDSKLIAIYFSAHWCKPCRKFTPILHQFHKIINSFPDKSIDIIFSSLDSSPEKMSEYFKSHGDWFAFQYKHPFTSFLEDKYKVEAIPTLLILDSEWNLITKKGKELISSGKPEKIENVESFRQWINLYDSWLKSKK